MDHQVRDPEVGEGLQVVPREWGVQRCTPHSFWPELGSGQGCVIDKARVRRKIAPKRTLDLSQANEL